MDIIKALKENEKPFGLMSEEMQAKAKEIKYDARNNPNFDYFNDGADWVSADRPDFGRNRTYRLRPDYEEKPEIVECEVMKRQIMNCNPSLDYSFDGDICSLHQAMTDQRFIGFKYEGSDLARPLPRRYRDPIDGHVYDFWREGYEVLTPTHVLFMKG